MNLIDKNTFRHRWLTIAKNCKFLPEEQFVKILYECCTSKKLDLKNPVTFNQKIQWYNIYYKHPLFTRLVDKYEVRSFVSEKVGAKYLNQVLGVYEDPELIDFEALPNQFVLKGTHGCAMNIIVRDKTVINWKNTVQTLKNWLVINNNNKGKEWAYKDVLPNGLKLYEPESMNTTLGNFFKLPVKIT